ncbi:MAG: hypothetical protein ABI946_12050, partial [Chthoniobacterales bacterium]
EAALGLPMVDAREWGPRLRFSAPPRLVEDFYRAYVDRLAPFIVYGSGDFHHLSGLWVRRFAEPLTVISFDNHPDWDIRPPRWCCGSWVNRALELEQVQKVSVWGCGNFECWWPGQAFGNRRAERAGILEVHAWADDRPLAQQQRRGAIFRGTWRDDFARFVSGLNSGDVYVTVDLDGLQAGDAVTNWENGKFATDDVAWALRELREGARVVGGDICGAYSPQRYARWKQGFVAKLDHPHMPVPNFAEAQEINRAAFETLWPILAN